MLLNCVCEYVRQLLVRRLYGPRFPTCWRSNCSMIRSCAGVVWRVSTTLAGGNGSSYTMPLPLALGAGSLLLDCEDFSTPRGQGRRKLGKDRLACRPRCLGANLLPGRRCKHGRRSLWDPCTRSDSHWHRRKHFLASRPRQFIRCRYRHGLSIAPFKVPPNSGDARDRGEHLVNLSASQHQLRNFRDWLAPK
jgi:hypothetical protein